MRLHSAILAFLEAIKEHNSRKYFAEVKDLYLDILENITDITKVCIQALATMDSKYTWLTAKDCLFRIYRDARRLKEGDLIYKQNFGIAIAPGGKKDSGPAYYLHIQPGNKSFFCGGIYWPNPSQLLSLRKYIQHSGNTYKKLTTNKKILSIFGELQGTKISRPPRGFEIDTPNLEFIKMKQHMFYYHISDKELLEIDFPSRFIEKVKILSPWIDFLETGIAIDS